MLTPKLTRLYAVLVFLLASAPSVAAQAEARQPFGIDDYFRLQHVSELALSSDGKMLAYVLRRPSLEQNKIVQTVYVSATKPAAVPFAIDSIQQARGLAWIPGTHELAFLGSEDGRVQVFSIDSESRKIKRHTNAAETVRQFRFAPDGRSLAWLTQADPDYRPSSLYDRLHHGDSGVVIDSENLFVSQFVDPERRDQTARPDNALWLRLSGGKTIRAEVPGTARTFYWSSDSSRLSVGYAAADIPRKSFFDRYTSLGILDAATGSLKTIARAVAPSDTEKAVYYDGGEWLPRSNTLFVRRRVEDDSWSRTTTWTSVDTSGARRIEDNAGWSPIPSFGGDPEPAFIATGRDTIYSVKTVNARQSLYEIARSGIKKARILDDVEGAVSMVQFSANFETAVFVNESLTRPQEIHVWRKGVGHRKLTGFNQAISNKQMPGARMLTWQSKDGVTVSGWLLEPAEARSDAHPWPLVTFVHGGPSSPALDEFAGQFIDYGGGIWPHPLEVLAMNGMAVFIPNYRGTATFGDRFDKPESLAGEPADDIVTGIERLLAEGVADSSHLAISGFSHGAWLAPLVMTRFPRFQAASVAEAAQNQIVNYYLVSGWVDWNVIDVQTGFSPYENPQLYLDQSPDLHFQGLNTAILFEAGVRNNAIGMMGSPKAAMHAGMPTEFVIYPKSAHGIPLPRLQRESAERNLDWFRFWLKDEEDPDSTKAEQYSRWRAMRATRCARDGAETPSYCRQR